MERLLLGDPTLGLEVPRVRADCSGTGGRGLAQPLICGLTPFGFIAQMRDGERIKDAKFLCRYFRRNAGLRKHVNFSGKKLSNFIFITLAPYLWLCYNLLTNYDFRQSEPAASNSWSSLSFRDSSLVGT